MQLVWNKELEYIVVVRFRLFISKCISYKYIYLFIYRFPINK